MQNQNLQFQQKNLFINLNKPNEKINIIDNKEKINLADSYGDGVVEHKDAKKQEDPILTDDHDFILE